MEKNKYELYSEGKYFDNDEDFWKWIKEWQFLPLDQETADAQLNTFKNDIIMNIFLKKPVQMNNGEFRVLLNKLFEFTMKYINLFDLYNKEL